MPNVCYIYDNMQKIILAAGFYKKMYGYKTSFI